MDSTTTVDVILARFGAAVRTRRESLGMTLADLSPHVGVQLAALSKIERGKLNVSLVLAAKIASALDTTLDALQTSHSLNANSRANT